MREPGDVVERRQRDVVGHPQPARPDRVQRAEGHQVVRREDHLGRLGQIEEPLGDPPPAVRLEVALPGVGVREGQPVLGQRRPEGLDPLTAGGGGGRPRDDREPPVPQPVQMRDQLPHGPLPVRADHRHVHPADPPVHEHHRRPRPRGVQHQRRAAVGGGDQEPVDPAVEEGADVVVLQIGPLVGVADDHAVAEGPGLLLDGAGQLGEVRVEHVADDQPQGAGLVGAQGTGDGVRPVAQRRDGGHHPRTGVGADRRVVVQDARDRGDGDPCRGGDVLDARHRRSTSLWNRLHRRVRKDWKRLHGGGTRGRYRIVMGGLVWRLASTGAGSRSVTPWRACGRAVTRDGCEGDDGS